MQTQSNPGWRHRWTVDLGKRQAQHGPTGLIVRFVTHASGQRRGEVLNGEEIHKKLSDAIKHAESKLAQLQNEAHDIYVKAITDDMLNAQN